VVWLIGESPLGALSLLIEGALGSGEGIGFTLYYATSFIFTGLSVAVAIHAGLFNIGSEGQAYLGGLGCALVALALDKYVPWYVTMPLASSAPACSARPGRFIPAFLQAKRGSHIVITTIMFNYIGAALMVYLLVHVLIVPGKMAPETRTFLDGGQLPKLGWVMDMFGAKLGAAPFNVSFIIALVAAWFVWLLIWRTRSASRCARSASARVRPPMPAFPMRARHHRHAAVGRAGRHDGAQPGHGLVGPPAGGVRRRRRLRRHRRVADGPQPSRRHRLSAILFGILYQGGDWISFEMPNITREMILVIQGLVILFAGALEYMFRPAMVRVYQQFKRA
jgi:ABC-type uncharacterized transport system permease subunit